MQAIQQKVRDAVAILTQSREAALEILKSEESLSSVVITVENGMNTLVNRLHFQLGESPIVAGTTEFKPLTKLDGVSFIQEEPAEAVIPDKSEIEILSDRIMELEKQLPGLANDQILKAYKTKADKLIIRGLAKKAGVPEFESAKIDEAFMEAIRNGIAGKREVKKQDKAAVLALIAKADTVEKVRELAAGSDDASIQDAALQRIIELEGGEVE